MKKILLLLIVSLLLTFQNSFAQTGLDGFQYQAVVRKADGKIIENQNFTARFTLLRGSSNGMEVYSEVQKLNTNQFGLFTHIIGRGVPVSSIKLTDIDFSISNYYLKVEVDLNGGKNFQPFGSSELIAVPFALYAKSSGSTNQKSNGVVGAPGPQGPMGDKGPAGDKGEAGDKGLTGPQGPMGDKGPTGDKGLIGPQGIKGDKGDTGLKGDTGSAGVDGSKGDKGDIGLTGPAGTTGPQGIKGDTGSAGVDGSKGDKGDIGLTGPAGATGPQGTKGDKGDTGLKGDIGAAGANGTNGVDGSKGDKGDIGLTGPAGATGSQGIKGDTGLKGDTGAAGANGTNGVDGSKGDKGDIGLTGPAGADGSTLADADATTKGKLQLSGDLTGTAAAPTISNSAITSVKIADGTITSLDLADGSITSAKINSMSATNGQVLKYSVATGWGPAIESAAVNWLTNGNNNTNSSSFLGNTNDVAMILKSNNLSMLQIGRRQTLGLTQSYPDYTNNDQPVVYINGDGITSSLQFAASAATFYKPMFFTNTDGNFRLKGSAAGTDFFEIGSAGTSNNGSLEFVIGDDGDEPIVFKKYNYTTSSNVEMMRMQGTGLNTDVRVGINVNGSTPNSTFQVAGSISYPITTTSSNITLDATNYTVIVTSGITVTLPIASSCGGRLYRVKVTGGTNARTNISFFNSSATSSTTLTTNKVTVLQSDGTDWQQVN